MPGTLWPIIFPPDILPFILLSILSIFWPFDPRGAALQRAQGGKVAAETATLKQTIAQMIADGKARGEARSKAAKAQADEGCK
ncbi:MAG: hypothetical protein V4671_01295 [Armatimonadota bacterium]